MTMPDLHPIEALMDVAERFPALAKLCRARADLIPVPQFATVDRDTRTGAEIEYFGPERWRHKR